MSNLSYENQSIPDTESVVFGINLALNMNLGEPRAREMLERNLHRKVIMRMNRRGEVFREGDLKYFRVKFLDEAARWMQVLDKKDGQEIVTSELPRWTLICILFETVWRDYFGMEEDNNGTSSDACGSS